MPDAAIALSGLPGECKIHCFYCLPCSAIRPLSGAKRLFASGSDISPLRIECKKFFWHSALISGKWLVVCKNNGLPKRQGRGFRTGGLFALSSAHGSLIA